jgi:hypothetical protein
VVCQQGRLGDIPGRGQDGDNDVIYIVHAIRMRQALPVSHVSAIMTDPCWDAPVAWPHDGGHHGFESGKTFAATYRRLGLNMLPKHATCKDAPIFLKTALPKWSNGRPPAHRTTPFGSVSMNTAATTGSTACFRQSAHNTTSNAAESTRQTADDKARKAFLAGGADAAYQAALTANSVTYFRAVIASGVANSIQVGTFQEGLHRLTGSYS